jgi:hypothetical protein
MQEKTEEQVEQEKKEKEFLDEIAKIKEKNKYKVKR